MKKIKIKLDDMERRILVKLLYEKRNELIREGRYAHVTTSAQKEAAETMGQILKM